MLIKNTKNAPCLKNIISNLGPLEILPIAALTIFVSIALYTNIISGKDNTAPIFSHGSGHYNSSILVKIKSPILGSQIYFSKDGSSPNQNSEQYTEPVQIEKTTVLKARIYKDSQPIGTEISRTYLINEHSTLPVISLTADSSDLWDPEYGIYTHKNQSQKGDDWVRQGKIEFFEPNDKTPAFTKNITLRIYGGKTRKTDQKSLKLCAAENDSIHYEIFPDYEVTKFKCLLLRNSGGDWNKTMFRDALMQEIIRENSNVTTQRYRPAVLYINGEYWGIHNIREDYNDNFLSNKYLGRRQDYAILFPDRDDKGRVRIEEGTQSDAEAFYELRRILDSEDVQQPEVIEKIRTYMDIENFFDYNIFELYFGNSDWMENNIKVWRYNGVDSIENSYYGNDGLFRWMAYDLDAGFGIVDEPPFTKNVLKLATVKRDYSGRAWPYVILRRLLVSEITSPIFINKYADMLNTIFKPDYLISKINKFQSTIEPEMPRHIERWKNSSDAWKNPYIQNMDEWYSNIDHMKNFATDRSRHIYDHLLLHFDLSGTYNLSIKIEGQGSVRVNSIEITNNSWEGKYFNGVEIELEAIPLKGDSFIKWEGAVGGDDKIIKFTGERDSVIRAVFK